MLSFLLIIARHKKLVAAVTLAGFLVSSGVSLILPQRFVSSAMFIPLGVARDITGLREFFKPLGAFGESFATYLRARKNYMIDFILRSRYMSDQLDARFDLKRVYGVKDAEEVRTRLQLNTSVVIRDEGAIVLLVEDRSPERAYAIANAYLSILDSLLIELPMQNSRESIAILSQEIARSEKEIARSDSLIERYLAHYSVYDIEEQVRAMLDIVSSLSARLSILDVEKRLLLMSQKVGNEELDKVELQWDKLREQIIMLRDTGSEPNLLPPLNKLPQITAGYLGLVSDRKVHEFVLQYLQLKLADAQILANSHVSTLRILDPPVIPEKRSWPRRKQIVLISTGAAFFWCCFALLVRDQVRAGNFKLFTEPWSGSLPEETRRPEDPRTDDRG
jgi:tyrosine-protein kinase Etk/Wzc